MNFVLLRYVEIVYIIQIRNLINKIFLYLYIILNPVIFYIPFVQFFYILNHYRLKQPKVYTLKVIFLPLLLSLSQSYQSYSSPVGLDSEYTLWLFHPLRSRYLPQNIHLQTNGAVLIPASECDRSLHDLPIFLPHCSDRSYERVLLYV